MENENVMTDKINDDSPFGVIFIIDDDDKTEGCRELIKKLRSILKHKSNLGFIWFNESHACASFEEEPMSEAICQY